MLGWLHVQSMIQYVDVFWSICPAFSRANCSQIPIYFTFFDIMNCIGHCNFECVPSWLQARECNAAIANCKLSKSQTGSGCFFQHVSNLFLVMVLVHHLRFCALGEDFLGGFVVVRQVLWNTWSTPPRTTPCITAPWFSMISEWTSWECFEVNIGET